MSRSFPLSGRRRNPANDCRAAVLESNQGWRQRRKKVEPKESTWHLTICLLPRSWLLVPTALIFIRQEQRPRRVRLWNIHS